MVEQHPLIGPDDPSPAPRSRIHRFIANTRAAVTRFFRHALSTRLVVSDSYGAEYQIAEPQLKQPSSGAPGQSSLCIDTGALFETRADLEEFPRFLSRSARLSALQPTISAAEKLARMGRIVPENPLRPHAPKREPVADLPLILSGAAAIAVVASVSIWAGNFGHNGSAIARNPRLGGTTEIAALPPVQGACDSALCTGTIEPAVTKLLAKSDMLDPDSRFAFAPRFAALYGTAALSIIAGLNRDAEMAANRRRAETPSLIRISNLPPDTELSKGRRIGPTVWEIAGNDTHNLIVTLPPKAQPISAEIAVIDSSGTAQSRVSIAMAAPAADDAQDPALTEQPKKLKPRRKPGAKAISPGETTQSGIAPKAQAPPPAFPFFSTNSEPLPPPMEPSAKTDTMINLGFSPR